MKSLRGNRTLIIINPKAGPGRIKDVACRIEKFSNYFDYAVFYDINEFRSFLSDKKDLYDIFVAAGGDGTVNSLVRELAGTGKTLAVLPVGSGNGFAREMGFRKSIRKLVSDLDSKKVFYTDVLYVNGIPCINVTGLGIDSYVAHEFCCFDQRGFWSYVAACFRVIFSMKPVKISLTMENKTSELEVFMLCLTNTRQFGNHAIIAPLAKPHDGKFNVVIVRPFPKILMPVFAIRLLTGTLKESRFVSYYETSSPVTINTSEKKFHIDGEAVLLDSPVKISLKNKDLKVLVTRRNKWLKKSEEFSVR